MKADKTLTAGRVLRRAVQTRAEKARSALLRRLGAELELFALARGMNAAQVAKAASVPVSTVLAAYEGDDITLNDLVRLSMALGARVGSR